MNLSQSVEQYVQEKQSSGLRFVKPNRNLVSFCRHVGDLPLDQIQTRQIETFLKDSQGSDVNRVRKYNLLRNFFLFWMARDMVRTLPMPPRRRATKRDFTPYIYSQVQIRRLLKSTRLSQANVQCDLDASTLHTFLLVLYGAGIEPGEGSRILRTDVDLTRRFLTIRNSDMHPTRTIPFASDLGKMLKAYSDAHHTKNHGEDSYFFLCKNGKPLKDFPLDHTFCRLRRVAGLSRDSALAQPPRMLDLRFTFAVHRLTAWHRHGADLNRMIPALSVYMGYANLNSAARFLRLTPERFKSQLNKLSPRQAKRHWRDDPVLMRFLSTL